MILIFPDFNNQYYISELKNIIKNKYKIFDIKYESENPINVFNRINNYIQLNKKDNEKIILIGIGLGSIYAYSISKYIEIFEDLILIDPKLNPHLSMPFYNIDQQIINIYLNMFNKYYNYVNSDCYIGNTHIIINKNKITLQEYLTTPIFFDVNDEDYIKNIKNNFYKKENCFIHRNNVNLKDVIKCF